MTMGNSLFKHKWSDDQKLFLGSAETHNQPAWYSVCGLNTGQMLALFHWFCWSTVSFYESLIILVWSLIVDMPTQNDTTKSRLMANCIWLTISQFCQWMTMGKNTSLDSHKKWWTNLPSTYYTTLSIISRQWPEMTHTYPKNCQF